MPSGQVADAHIHLDKLAEEEALRLANGGEVCAVAIDAAGCRRFLELRSHAANPQNLHIFFGKHPELGDPGEVEEIIGMIRENAASLAGIGEIGIPYFNLRKLPPSERERARARELGTLERFLALAGELSLPVNLHIVGDDVYPCLELLRRHRPPAALFHWFVGNSAAVQAIRSCPVRSFISVNVDIVADPSYAAYAAALPADLLLVETDAPYFYHADCAALGPADACAALARLRGEPQAGLELALAANLDAFLGRGRRQEC